MIATTLAVSPDGEFNRPIDTLESVLFDIRIKCPERALRRPPPMPKVDFDDIVDRFYQALYRFGYSLSKCEATASDLTQQTFFIWARKGDQLRDATKVKSWLFTTLYREFLKGRNRAKAHPQISTENVESELPQVSPDVVRRTSVNEVLEAMQQLDETFRAPLVLFHVEDFSYKEIAESLSIPIGTVMSRLARGREQLFNMLQDEYTNQSGRDSKIVPMKRKGGQ